MGAIQGWERGTEDGLIDASRFASSAEGYPVRLQSFEKKPICLLFDSLAHIDGYVNE